MWLLEALRWEEVGVHNIQSILKILASRVYPPGGKTSAWEEVSGAGITKEKHLDNARVRKNMRYARVRGDSSRRGS